MSKTKIEKYIDKIEKEFVLNFEAETAKILEQKQADFDRDSAELKEKTLKRIKKEQDEVLATTQQALDFEEKSKGEALKSLMIEEIYEDVLSKLKSLEGEHLRKLVVRLIESESLTGKHRLLVRKANYDKFYQALSDKENCDLLNKELKNTTCHLEIYDDAVELGFIVEDREFDLVFDFQALIENHKQVHAFDIYTRLFGAQ